MADLALGTQTAGSIIRPASFCGVIGFKPTFGLVSTVGVKAVAPSCDTVGWFVRDPTLLTQVWAAVLGASAPPPSPKSIRFGVLRTRDWNFADDVSRTAVLDASQRLRQLGHNTRELQLENVVAETGRAQKVIMMYEALRSLLWEYTVHADLIGGASLAALDAATELTTADYQEALAAVETARCCINDLFEDADVIITPAAIGEAPLGHSSTGDPMFARAWTQLGVPTAAVPWTTGPHGLPVAVQLIARPNHDATLISAVQYLAEIGPNSSEQPASSAH
jgi:Asp-tRNA(Asn)/Glu-tRNA(Gln) amidotransferase A subunit family amidase